MARAAPALSLVCIAGAASAHANNHRCAMHETQVCLQPCEPMHVGNRANPCMSVTVRTRACPQPCELMHVGSPRVLGRPSLDRTTCSKIILDLRCTQPMYVCNRMNPCMSANSANPCMSATVQIHASLQPCEPMFVFNRANSYTYMFSQGILRYAHATCMV